MSFYKGPNLIRDEGEVLDSLKGWPTLGGSVNCQGNTMEILQQQSANQVKLRWISYGVGRETTHDRLSFKPFCDLAHSLSELSAASLTSGSVRRMLDASLVSEWARQLPTVY